MCPCLLFVTAGQDPDFHRRDLWGAIESGNFPEFELGLQIVEEKDEHSFNFDLLVLLSYPPSLPLHTS